ncbi:MAG: phosphotriesterase family protein [Candidatus Limnocylindrales bacterium]
MTRVVTVTGPVASTELGTCLSHEHILNDVTSWWHRTESLGLDPDEFARKKVGLDDVWDLRHDPFGNLDNCRLDDLEVAIEEVARFAALGGRTIIEATGLSIGRDLAGLRTVSQRSGVQIVAGTGFYLEASQPAEIASSTVDRLAELILADIRDGQDGVRPGIIGEIGVSDRFTDAEQRSLRAACLAQRETGLPMQVHLPAWFRLGHDVLDLVEGMGVAPCAVVLCHMNPSGPDPAYQRRLMDRGAWVQYDMVGAELFYADQGVQCTSDEQDAANIAALVRGGFGGRLLISSDIFLKSLLRRYGGPGYGHVLQYFVPRLERHGLNADEVEQLLVRNPRYLFEQAEAC